MKNQTISKFLAFLTILLCAATAQAKLEVGDPAPKLQVAKWVQGDPVKELTPGTAYVVEFWATWCGPCVTAIPHLNALHEKFKDQGLVVIGQDVWEQDESKVVPFIKSMGTKMTYRVALDDKSSEKEGAMSQTWMRAAGRNGIPSSFVVNKHGVIAWIGHPMQLKAKLLEDVLADRFDIKKAVAEQEHMEANQAQLTALFQKFSTSMKEKNWDAAEAALNDATKLLTEEQLGGLKMQRSTVLIGKGDFKGAYKLIEATSDENLDEPEFQNRVAWDILTKAEFDGHRDTALAEKMAVRAATAAKGQDANILDTLARAQFMNGKKKEAIATQQKAVELAVGKDKEIFKSSLESFQKGELPKRDN